MTSISKQTLNNHYSMLIEWSEEDDAYVVSFPEFPGAHTHGTTYVEAVKNGQEVLRLPNASSPTKALGKPKQMSP